MGEGVVEDLTNCVVVTVVRVDAVDISDTVSVAVDCCCNVDIFNMVDNADVFCWLFLVVHVLDVVCVADAVDCVFEVSDVNNADVV